MHEPVPCAICQRTILRGETPPYVVNAEVTAQPGYQAKLAALRNRWKA